MRLLAVDDFAPVRDAVRRWVHLSEDVEIVGEASNGVEAIGLTADLNPDVILMDLNMPILDGLSASKVIRQTNPNTRILAFTSHHFTGLPDVIKSLGFSGFVTKGEDAQGLLRALDALAFNQTYFPS
jgi:DNA-binding NarL/FixJ family response regulator